jgi:hypothetical protein
MNPSLNGHHPADTPAALRLVWFGQSVISDWNNPIATTVRATMRALHQTGHTVTFLEPRNNQPLVSALAARGSSMYRDFQRLFPDLHYRTYDMPRRAERDVWLSREAALVDAVIIQSDAPVEVFEWLERLPEAPMTRVLIALDEAAQPLDLFDLVLSPATVGIGERFEPAVLPEAQHTAEPRDGIVVTVYSDVEPAFLESLVAGERAEVFATGAGAPHDLPFVSEVAIAERYATAEKVLVVDVDTAPFAAARTMLPVAAGAETVRVNGPGLLEPVNTFVDAREQSANLVHLIRDVRMRRQAERASGQLPES